MIIKPVPKYVVHTNLSSQTLENVLWIGESIYPPGNVAFAGFPQYSPQGSGCAARRSTLFIVRTIPEEIVIEEMWVDDVGIRKFSDGILT